MISFEPRVSNQLLMNPKLPDGEKKILLELAIEFEKQVGSVGYFLIASSGSSKKESESVKLIALSREAVLNSAQRFNQFFKANHDDIWGLVLPTFHVAGLSVLARAFLTSSKVVLSEWNPATILEWMNRSQITHLSLIPTQIYDLLQLKMPCPAKIKKVFVGGGQLSGSLRQAFENLGWPCTETYGMTETCSMIAVREDQRKDFTLLPGVKVKTEKGLLQINCNSLAQGMIQKKLDKFIVTLFANDWLQTEDKVLLTNDGIELLGRTTDYIKILGEGVSLPELRDKLNLISSSLNQSLNQYFLFSVADERAENILVLVVEDTISTQVAEEMVAQFNQAVRGYEKIYKLIRIDRIPVTDLGKVKFEELKIQTMKKLNRRLDDKKV